MIPWSGHQAGIRAPGWTRRRMLDARLAMPIFVRARARPMVRMISRITCFCTANTCSAGARLRDRLALPRRTCEGRGRPGARRRWMWLMNPCRSRNVSFCCYRYARRFRGDRPASVLGCKLSGEPQG